jgi:hypothetical protein
MEKKVVAQSKEGLLPSKRKSGEGVPPDQRPVNRTRRKRGNQWTTNPQQLDFIRYFISDRSAETYGNALLSGLKAGYERSYAEKITHEMPEWLLAWTRENITDEELVKIGEQNLRDDMTMDVTQPVVTPKGLLRDEKGELIRLRDPRLMKLKADQSKFGMQALNPKKYADTKKLAGADGEQLAVRILVD